MKKQLFLTFIAGLLLSACESIGAQQDSEDWRKSYLATSMINPNYPRKAQIKGIEGYCVVEFKISKTGEPEDLKAIDCQPVGYFEEASVQAVSRFRFQPRIENGKPVESSTVRNKFVFELTEYPVD